MGVAGIIGHRPAMTGPWRIDQRPARLPAPLPLLPGGKVPDYRGIGFDGMGVAMSKLDEKREEIAALVAAELGLGELAGLSEADRAAVDRHTSEAIEGYALDTDEPADGTEAGTELKQRLREYCALLELRTDEADARLAEQGEVFGREDDA